MRFISHNHRDKPAVKPPGCGCLVSTYGLTPRRSAPETPSLAL
jgi:hypothetical protein